MDQQWDRNLPAIGKNFFFGRKTGIFHILHIPHHHHHISLCQAKRLFMFINIFQYNNDFAIKITECNLLSNILKFCMQKTQLHVNIFYKLKISTSSSQQHSNLDMKLCLSDTHIITRTGGARIDSKSWRVYHH